MKKNLFLLPGIFAALALAVWLSPAGAQSQTSDGSEYLPVLQVVSQQQALIADNQSKIDASLAKIQEELRVAKIYASRSGKK